MSKFMEFYAYITEDEAVNGRFTSLAAQLSRDFDMAKFSDGNQEQLLSIIDGLIAFAKEEGFDFTREEVAEYLNGFARSGELSEEELSAVAGGKGGCFIIGAGAQYTFASTLDCIMSATIISKDPSCGCLVVGGKFEGGGCIIIGYF